MELSSKKIEFIERILSKKIFKYRGSIVGGTDLPQKKGFIRLSKLRKLPLDIVVKTWYDTHKDFHKLSDKQVDKLINKILEY